MCGIVGITSSKKINPVVMKALLLMAQSRGTDAAGVATIDTIIKKAVPARSLIRELKIPETNTIIGHTRAATVGAKEKDSNAHPFRYGKIVGAHNGGIGSYLEIAKKYETTFEVDSMAAFYLIDKIGLDEALKELSGGFALSWIDEEEKLHLYRHANPIFIGEYEDGVLYGSDEKYLQTIGASSIRSVPEHTELVYKDGILLEQREPKVTHKQPVYNNNYYRGYENWDDRGSFYKKKNRDYKTAPKNSQWYTDPELGPVAYWLDQQGIINIEISEKSKYNKNINYIAFKLDPTNPTDLTELKLDYPQVFKNLITA